MKRTMQCGLLLATIAFAQPGRYHPQSGGYGYETVERVKRDVLSMARSAYPYVDGEKRDLFRDTIRHLDRFQDNARRGKFDTGRLDDAIDEMKRLAGSNQIHPRMKPNLWRDIQILRDLRAARGRLRFGDAYRGRW